MKQAASLWTARICTEPVEVYPSHVLYLIPTGYLREKAKVLQENVIAQQATLLAEREKQRADTLVNYLRSLGIDPEQIY